MFNPFIKIIYYQLIMLFDILNTLIAKFMISIINFKGLLFKKSIRFLIIQKLTC